LRTKTNVPTFVGNDLYSKAILNLKVNNENNALVALLETHEKINKMDIPTDKWVSLDECLPPNTNRSIVIYDTYMDTNNKTIYVSYVFLQHYLMNKYFYGFKQRSLMKNITYFMLLSDPNAN
jgi:hypothetical protein